MYLVADEASMEKRKIKFGLNEQHGFVVNRPNAYQSKRRIHLHLRTMSGSISNAQVVLKFISLYAAKPV